MKPTLEEHALAEALRRARNAEREMLTEEDVDAVLEKGTPLNAMAKFALRAEPGVALRMVYASDQETEPTVARAKADAFIADIHAMNDALSAQVTEQKARADAAELEVALLRAELSDARGWAGRWKGVAKRIRRESDEIVAALEGTS